MRPATGGLSRAEGGAGRAASGGGGHHGAIDRQLLSLHFHILVPDAVFIRDGKDPDARPRTVEIDPPINADVAALLDDIIERVFKTLKKHGRLDDDLDDEPEPQMLLALRPASGPRGPFVEEPLPPLCARKDGYSRPQPGRLAQSA